MSGWRSTLNLTGVLSQLLTPYSPGPTSHPEPIQNAQASGSASPLGLLRRRSLQNIAHLSTKKECIVCRSDSGEVEFSMDTPTSACNHGPLVCVNCLEQIILIAITSGDYIAGILCPSPDCAQRLDYYDVQKWATRDTFDRYDKLLLQDSLRTDEHYVLCLEPSCAAGQEHTGGESNNIVTCHSCGTKQCFRHQVLWHEGFTCAQWDEHQRTTTTQQERSDEWILANTKPCPGPGCGRRIEKANGCDHLTCRPPGGCGHQFCWECLAPWAPIIRGDNSKHYDHCQYYTGRPGGNPAPPDILASATLRSAPLPGRDSLPPPARPFVPRPFIMQADPRAFDIARAATTRAPPVANQAAEARRAALRRNRQVRIVETPPVDILSALRQRGPHIRPAAFTAAELMAMPAHLRPDIQPAGPREPNQSAGLSVTQQRARPWAPPPPPYRERQNDAVSPGNSGRGFPVGNDRARPNDRDRRVASDAERGSFHPRRGDFDSWRDFRQALGSPPITANGTPASGQSFLPMTAPLPQQLQAEPTSPHGHAVAGPGPRTRRGQNGMDPRRQAELQSWLENTQSSLPPPPPPPSHHPVNRPAESTNIYPFLQMAQVAAVASRGTATAPGPPGSPPGSAISFGPSRLLRRQPPPLARRGANGSGNGSPGNTSNMPTSFATAMNLTLGRRDRFDGPSE